MNAVMNARNAVINAHDPGGRARGAGVRILGRRAVLAIASLLVGTTVLRGADGRLNFVACPMVRDTATVPCWLAEYDGELYFLTIQSDVSAPVTPPWLGHRVLVEGTVSKEERICGGVVLKPVHLSVLPERDASCNTMLPAEERYNLTFEPPRPPGPARRRDWERRAFRRRAPRWHPPRATMENRVVARSRPQPRRRQSANYPRRRRGAPARPRLKRL